MKYYVLITLTILMHCAGIAQDRNWTEEKSDDGKVTVKSDVESSVNEAGDDIKIIYYIAETTQKLDLEKAEKFMRNSSNYKLFWEHADESKEIKRISENEWIIYLYFDAPWPMPNTDCVHHMTFQDNGDKGFIVTAKPKPDAYEKKDVGRIQIYDAVFTFEDAGNGLTHLKLDVKFSPVGDPPKWMLNAWLPDGPIGIVTRLLENAAK